MAVFTPPRPLLESDDREGFDCGRDAMNTWFRRHAWANQLNLVSRINVATEAASGRIAGYVALSATQIERAFMPKPQQRNRPVMVPAFLLGQLAVDRAFQGQGLARSLLLFALTTAWRASAVMGSTGVVTHPIDDSVRGFYAGFGFEPLPFDPQRSMFVRMADLKQLFGDPPAALLPDAGAAGSSAAT